jgi:hypothetical protein
MITRTTATTDDRRLVDIERLAEQVGALSEVIKIALSTCKTTIRAGPARRWKAQ